ncbi:MAG: ferrous iron transport protein A [candidate division Zixibacteria bacterium]|nr:ferrous iron transport protein A [candidate division Zixibacteria bacterium]
MTFLNKMIPGQRAKVIGFTQDSPLVRRLRELGIGPGKSVTCVCRAPLNDPLLIRIGASRLSLRRADASLVTVEIED